MASRILGMGDVLSLIEKAEAEVDEEKAEELERKLRKAKFTLEDMLDQCKQIRKMGSLPSILGCSPACGKQLEGHGRRREGDRAHGGDHPLDDPARSARTRRSSTARAGKRIAKGSGTNVQQINRLLQAVPADEEDDEAARVGKMPAMPQLEAATAADAAGRPARSRKRGRR